MALIVRALWLASGRARSSCNDRVLWKFFSARRLFWGPVHTNPFSNENGAVLLRFQKDLRPHLSFSSAHTTTPYIRFENAVLLSMLMLKWTRRMRISIYRPAKLALNWSHMVAYVRHFGYSRSSGLAPGRVYRHRFQIASFFPSTLEKSVFRKHRFQITPLWRAFSNGSVCGDRFRRCSVDDNRIQSKTAPFSFENGLVWTGSELWVKATSATIFSITEDRIVRLDPQLLWQCYDEIHDVLSSLSFGQYIKAAVWDFPVMTSLSVNKWCIKVYEGCYVSCLEIANCNW